MAVPLYLKSTPYLKPNLKNFSNTKRDISSTSVSEICFHNNDYATIEVSKMRRESLISYDRGIVDLKAVYDKGYSSKAE